MSLVLAWRMCRRRWVLWLALAICGGLAIATQLAAARIERGLTDAGIPGTKTSQGHQVLCWSLLGEPERCRFSYLEVDALLRSDVAEHLTFFTATPVPTLAPDGESRSGTLVVADPLLGEKLGWETQAERWPLRAFDPTRPAVFLLSGPSDQANALRQQVHGQWLEVAGFARAFGTVFERSAQPVMLTSLPVAHTLGLQLSDELPIWQILVLPGQTVGLEQVLSRAGSALAAFRPGDATLHASGPLHVDPKIAARASRLQGLASGIGWAELAGTLFGLFCTAVLIWVASAQTRFVLSTLGGSRARLLYPQLLSVVLFGSGGLLLGAVMAPLLAKVFLDLATAGAPGSAAIETSFSSMAIEGFRIAGAYLSGVLLVAGFAVLLLVRWSSTGIRLQQRVMRFVLSGFVAATILTVVMCLALGRTLVGLQSNAENFSFKALTVYSLDYGPSKAMFPSDRGTHEAFVRLMDRLSSQRTHASMSGALTPLTGWYDEDGILTREDGSETRVKVARISETYFDTIRLDLLAGQMPRYEFGADGKPATPAMVVINTRMMRLLGWASPELAVGKTLTLGTLDSWDSLEPGATSLPAIQRTVTAVVDEGSSGAAGTSSLNPMVKDLPPLAYFVDLRLNRPLLFTDAAISPEVVLEEINRLAGTAYDSVRIGWVRRGEEIEESILRPDRSAFLVAGFAAFALMLSMMVLVVAFLRVWIDSQLKALAIEFALGAKPADVIRRACGQLVPSLMFGAGIGAVSLLAVPPMSGGVISHSIGALLPDFVIAGGAVLCLLGVTTAPTLWRLGRTNFANELKSL